MQNNMLAIIHTIIYNKNNNIFAITNTIYHIYKSYFGLIC